MSRLGRNIQRRYRPRPPALLGALRFRSGLLVVGALRRGAPERWGRVAATGSFVRARTQRWRALDGVSRPNLRWRPAELAHLMWSRAPYGERTSAASAEPLVLGTPAPPAPEPLVFGAPAPPPLARVDAPVERVRTEVRTWVQEVPRTVLLRIVERAQAARPAEPAARDGGSVLEPLHMTVPARLLAAAAPPVPRKPPPALEAHPVVPGIAESRPPPPPPLEHVTLQQPAPAAPLRPAGAPRDEAPPVRLRPSLGQPLPPVVREVMERRLGFDPGEARVHTGEEAAEAASALRAAAFSLGRDVYFARGRFDPGTPSGRALLAHELTHIRQQPPGRPFHAEELPVQRQAALEAEAANTAPATPAPHAPAPVRALVLRPPAAAARQAPAVPLLAPLEPTAAREPAAGPEPPAPPPGAAPAEPVPPDTRALADEIYRLLQRRQRIERERTGIRQWR